MIDMTSLRVKTADKIRRLESMAKVAPFKPKGIKGVSMRPSSMTTAIDLSTEIENDRDALIGDCQIQLYLPLYVKLCIDRAREIESKGDLLPIGATIAVLIRAGSKELFASDTISTYISTLRLTTDRHNLMSARSQEDIYVYKSQWKFQLTQGRGNTKRVNARCSTYIHANLEKRSELIGMTMTSLGTMSIIVSLSHMDWIVHGEHMAAMRSAIDSLMIEIGERNTQVGMLLQAFMPK